MSQEESNEASRKESNSTQVGANFSSREKMVIVRYLLYKKVDTSEIHKLLSAVCRETAPTYKDVRDWIKEIKILESRERLEKASRKLSYLSDTDPALTARLEALLNIDQRISVEQMSEMTTVSTHTVQNIVDKLLGLKRVCERWVPRLWTPDQRAYRVAISKDLWDLYQIEGINMLSRIIVGEESFALYYSANQNSVDPEIIQDEQTITTNYESPVEWKRMYFTVFFDMEGMLVSEALPNEEQCTKEQYVGILKNSLMPALKEERKHITKPIYLLQSMTPIHCSLQAKEALNELGIESLPNVPASPDLEPHDYWFFKNLKKHVNGKNFYSRAELWCSIKQYIGSIKKKEYHDSIFKLVSRWNSCVEGQGLYFL